MINLPSPKTKKKSKQVGRGIGTGKGSHTTGRGTKGQRSRSGYTKPGPAFEGGQMPISRRLPKLKGFRRAYFKSLVINAPVKLSKIEEISNDGDTITIETLLNSGLVKAKTHKDTLIKVLFDKDVTKKLNLENIAVSQKAKESIEKAGGSVK